nr:EOG090X09CU [Eulimnadia texana]
MILKLLTVASRELVHACLAYVDSVNKYSKEANLPSSQSDEPEDWRAIDKPYRMSKINLVWAKAKKRLTDAKLKTLYSELKVHDKEELQLKRLRADGLDKDGLQEAKLRNKFLSVLERYGLADHFDEDATASKTQPKEFNEAIDDHINKSLFKDKRLNKLWMKAESAGFTETELKALKQEFYHHQQKVDEFYSVLEETDAKGKVDNNSHLNEVLLDNLQTLEEERGLLKNREKHREIKNGYDRLQRMALSGPKSKDFEESKVQALWRLAMKADFSPEELESLQTELRHYEQRLLKLRHLHAQQALAKEKTNQVTLNMDDLKELEKRVKHQERKVEKLHGDLESRITQRHLEL